MKLFIICMFLVSSAWGATFTAVASGDWQATATWGTSGSGCHVAFPCMTDASNAGDTAVIGNFTVTCGLTVTETCSAGTSTNDATTLAIQLTGSTGALTLANSSTLVYAGTVSAGQGNVFTVGAGSKIQYDSSWSSQSAAPNAVTMSGATATFTSAVNFPSLFVSGTTFAAAGFSPIAYNRIWTITGGGAGTTSLTATSVSTTGLSAATALGTLATDPLYRFNWGAGFATGTAPRLMLNGTSAAHITWQGDASFSPLVKAGSPCSAGVCLAGAINLPGTGCSNNIGFGTQTFVDYSNIWGLTNGNTNVAYCGSVGSTTVFGSLNYSDITVNNSGTFRIAIAANPDANSIVLSSMQFTNCSSASLADSCLRYGPTSGNSGGPGPYSITGLITDGGVNALNSPIDSPFILRNFFMWTGQGGGVPSGAFGFPTTTSTTGGVYDQIFVDSAAWNLGPNQVLYDTYLGQNMKNSVIWSDRTMQGSGHLHLLKNSQSSVGTAGSYSQTNNVFGGVGSQDGSTNTVYTATAGVAPTVATNYLFQGNVELCGYLGFGGAPMLIGGYISGAAGSNLFNTIRQNTVCNVLNSGGTQPTPGAGGAESVVTASGTVPSIDSNLLFSNASSGIAMNLIQSPADPNASPTQITFLGFNAVLNSTSYSQQFSGNNYVATFGPDTVLPTRLPAFGDRLRSVPFFDTDFLTPAGIFNVASYGASPWVSGHAYSVGTVVSFSDPTVYGGKTSYWRCITAHDSGSTNQPYFGFDASNPWTGFYAFWELAYYQFFRTQVYNLTTFNQQCAALLYISCPSPTYITGLLNAWLRAGYVSMEVPLWRACSPDRGTTFQECGAMPLPAIQHIVPAISVN